MADEIENRISRVQELANQLVLVVGLAGSGKTRALREIAERANYRYVVVGLGLGEALLDVPPSERPRQVARSLEDLVLGRGPVVLLDNLEILFEPSLRVDPMGLLDTLSRSRTVVAAWTGTLDGSTLTYARPGHPEYRAYPVGQRVLVGPGIRPAVEDD